MPANSLVRRAAKRALHPLFNESSYRFFQACAKAFDIRRGHFGEPEVALLRFLVSRGDVVLDIGANYGFYTYPLSRAVGAEGHVYAFEPVPFTFRTLQLVVRLLRLRNVTLVPKGCSESAGRVNFAVPVQESGAPSAGQAYIGERNDARAGAETQVRWSATKNVECEVISLDRYLPELARLSLVKCDIEGAELFAFRGAVQTIERHLPSIICEINPWFLDGFNLRLHDLLEFFCSRGYIMYHYTEGRLIPVEESQQIEEDNYVFIHGSRASSIKRLL